jgi:2-polyprenyl-6-methoxyphenol hydroxylase-like FAD-dependent oxidoreductase
MSHKDSFKVIIAGGGIAGLTLANSLSQTHISYVLLEARDEIAPQVGASIDIFAQGGRILDQVGAYDDIANLIHPSNTSISGTTGMQSTELIRHNSLKCGNRLETLAFHSVTDSGIPEPDIPWHF